MRAAIIGVSASVLVGCAARPQMTTRQLSADDPKFNSPECLDIRARALSYNDRVGERLAVGVVSGLLLGPFGIPIAAAADIQQNQERETFNREIALRCMTNPPAELLTPGQASAPAPAADARAD